MSIYFRWRIISALGLVLGSLAGLADPSAAPTPLTRTHAHNDYEHKRPLFDALDHGFCSVEADIFLVEGQLLVAHNRSDVSPSRTLQSLYLDPLLDRARMNHGKIHGSEPQFWLLIDIKSDADSVWPVLRDVLEKYREMLTVFRDDHVETKAVTVVLSGNRPRRLLALEKTRLASLDGLLSDLETNPPSALVPWISENWGPQFKWRGRGEFASEEKEKLRAIVEKAHQQKRLVRFWGAPDIQPVWRELLAGGVDLVNSDDLAGLEKFLVKNPLMNRE